ncbi:MAG: hotdog domain-containing protein [Nitratireductor sp.]
MPRQTTDLSNRLIENGHEMEVRVYYEDTDFSGVVYHSNYLKYMERSRTEWLRHLEIFHTDLEKDDSAFAIHRMSLKFGPACQDRRSADGANGTAETYRRALLPAPGSLAQGG